MRVIIAYKSPQVDNPIACHAGLGITASNAADVLNEYGIHASAEPVADGYFLRKQLRNGAWPGVTHVVMCAPFFDTPFLRALCAEFQCIQFAIVFHSNVGFLAVDNWSTKVLCEEVELEAKTHNFRVCSNSVKFSRVVNQAFNAPCTILPNLYFLHGPIERKRVPWCGNVIKVGTFGATRILKNLPTAAWAALIMARKLRVRVEFHVSAGRVEGKGADALTENVRRLFCHHEDQIRLIEDRWQPWLDFRRNIVRRMDLLMQPSFTESFNNVTADGIAEGVASVVGGAIDWVPHNWKAEPDDANDIARVGINLLRDKDAPQDGHRALEKHNLTGIEYWKDFLKHR